MLFIIVFSLAIAGITVTDLPIVIFLLRSPALILFFLSKIPLFSSKLYFAKKWLITISIACFLALLSWQWYQWRYKNPDQGLYYISTGTINETLSSGKYLYTDGKREFLLYSQIPHTPGNQIRLVANNSFVQTSSPPLRFIARDSIFYSGFNGPKRSKMKGYSNILYETNSVFIQTGLLSGFSKVRYFLRERLERTYKKNQTAGLVLGMLIGDKSKFSKSEYQLFINSGLVHLVAVSGGNIVMLVTFLTAILFFLPFYFRIFLILLAVLGYGIICGMDSSVLRAVCMGSLSLVALLVGKGASLRRLLGMVYIGMLCYNPYFLVYDVGILLSFSAVLGIVFIDVLKKEPKKSTERENQQFACNIGHSRFVVWSGKICYGIRSNYLKPSIGATLGIFPIIIFFMGQINIGGCVGNLFVLPLVPFIMIGGFIGGFLPFGRQKYYTPLIDFLVAWNYKVATWIDQYGITIVANTPWIKFLFLGISIFTMALVIKTLTNHELATTAKDVPNKDVDKSPAHFYNNILSTLPVEPSKKS